MSALPSEFTFTRASTGTYFDSAGVLQSAATNAPRFDHVFNATSGLWVPKGLLIEGAATNLQTYSRDLTNAAYSKGNGSESADTRSSVDGGTADDFTADGVGAAYFSESYTLVSGTSYTYTAIVEYINNRWLTFGTFSTAFTNGSASFDLVNGVVGTKGANIATTSIQRLGGNFFRIRATVAATASGNGTWRLYLDTADVTVGTVASGQKIGVDFQQWEATAHFTSPITTTTVSVTRAKDVCSILTSAIPSFSATEGTIVIEAERETTLTTGNIYPWSLDDGTADENIYTYINGTVPAYRFAIEDGGVSQVLLANLGTQAGGVSAKLATAWKLNDTAGVVNGGTVFTDTAATLPTVTTLRLGSRYDVLSAGQWDGTIKSLTYYPTRLPNASLKALST